MKMKRSIQMLIGFVSGVLLAPPGNADFISGTRILQENLTTTPIEVMTVGDLVTVRYESGLAPCYVWATFYHPNFGGFLKVTTSVGQVVEVSNTQPFLLSDGTYKQARNLTTGDLLVDMSNQHPAVTKVESALSGGSGFANLWIESSQNVPMFASGVAVGDDRTHFFEPLKS
jgi:hypothetical protein